MNDDIYRMTEKSCHTFLSRVIFKKEITVESERKEQVYIKCWKCSGLNAISSFLISDGTR
jgi:RNase P subunit RPR2